MSGLISKKMYFSIIGVNSLIADETISFFLYFVMDKKFLF